MKFYSFETFACPQMRCDYDQLYSHPLPNIFVCSLPLTVQACSQPCQGTAPPIDVSLVAAYRSHAIVQHNHTVSRHSQVTFL